MTALVKGSVARAPPPETHVISMQGAVPHIVSLWSKFHSLFLRARID